MRRPQIANKIRRIQYQARTLMRLFSQSWKTQRPLLKDSWPAALETGLAHMEHWQWMTDITFTPQQLPWGTLTSWTFRSGATSCWDVIWPQTESKDKRRINNKSVKLKWNCQEEPHVGTANKVWRMMRWMPEKQLFFFFRSKCLSRVRVLIGNRQFEDTRMFYRAPKINFQMFPILLECLSWWSAPPHCGPLISIRIHHSSPPAATLD